MSPKHLLHLPVIADVTSDDPILTAQRRASWCCHVLIVEDDDSTRARLAAWLTLAGYEVETAMCAEDAMRIQAISACQIVITTWKSSSIDAPALCRRLRAADADCYVYCIILTAGITHSDTLEALAAGADDCIEMTSAFEAILARIDVGKRIMRHENHLRANFEESQRLSITDALTGAYNRRYLLRNLPSEIARSRRYQHPLAILCCDLDWFKRVNDCFGHEAGDEVLRQFVSRSRDCLREPVDWIARTGGEEFVVVMPETNLSGAICVADKLRRALSGDPIPTCAGRLSVTVSVGTTALETAEDFDTASVVEILRAADRCLYISKRAGRDRITAMPASRAMALDLDTFGRKEYELN